MKRHHRSLAAIIALGAVLGCAGETLVPRSAQERQDPIAFTPDGNCSSYSNQDIEGELIGSIYNGTTRICLPGEIEEARRLELSFVSGGGYLSGYDPVFYLVDHLNDRDFHLHWNDLNSTDADGCDGASMAERHSGSMGDDLELHCIAPGRYFLTMFDGATQVKQVDLDYVHPASNIGMQQPHIRSDVYETGRMVLIADESYVAPGYIATDHYVHFNIGTAVAAVTPTEILEADASGTDPFLLNWSPMQNTDLVVATDEVLRVDVGRTRAPGLAQGEFMALHRITWETGVSTGWFTSTINNNHTRTHIYGGSARCVTLRHEVAYPSDIGVSGIVVPAARRFDRTVDVGGGCAGRTHPDLVPGTIAPVGTLPSNGSGTVNVTVQNTGTGSSIAGTVKVYLSTSATFPTSAPIGSATVPVIASSGSTVVAVPVTTVNAGSGTRYLHVEVDAQRTSSELHESNNRGQTTTLVGDLPDLRVTRVLNPLNRMIGAGSAAYVEVHFKNFGTGTAPLGWLGSVALSTDTIYGAGDVVLGTFSPAGALQPYGQMGDSGLQAFYFSAPVGTTPGQYYLVAKVDSTNVITESNEGNNTGPGTVMSLTANGFQPDLVVDSVTMPFGASTDDVSQSKSWMRVWYRNAGNATAPAGYTIRGYLSTNTSCCTGDILAWSIVTTSSLAPGATATAGPKFFLPDQSGAYYFFGHVNAIPAWGLSEPNQVNDLKRTTGTFMILF
jgi:hypothetical protein